MRPSPHAGLVVLREPRADGCDERARRSRRSGSPRSGTWRRAACARLSDEVELGVVAVPVVLGGKVGIDPGLAPRGRGWSRRRRRTRPCRARIGPPKVAGDRCGTGRVRRSGTPSPSSSTLLSVSSSNWKKALKRAREVVGARLGDDVDRRAGHVAELGGAPTPRTWTSSMVSGLMYHQAPPVSGAGDVQAVDVPAVRARCPSRTPTGWMVHSVLPLMPGETATMSQKLRRVGRSSMNSASKLVLQPRSSRRSSSGASAVDRDLLGTLSARAGSRPWRCRRWSRARSSARCGPMPFERRLDGVGARRDTAETR